MLWPGGRLGVGTYSAGVMAGWEAGWERTLLVLWPGGRLGGNELCWCYISMLCLGGSEWLPLDGLCTLAGKQELIGHCWSMPCTFLCPYLR